MRRPHRHLGGVDLSALVDVIDEGATIESGDLIPAASLLSAIGGGEGAGVEGLGRLVAAVEGPDAEPTPGIVAACVELALEGLWLTRRIDKDETDGRTLFSSARDLTSDAD